MARVNNEGECEIFSKGEVEFNDFDLRTDARGVPLRTLRTQRRLFGDAQVRNTQEEAESNSVLLVPPVSATSESVYRKCVQSLGDSNTDCDTVLAKREPDPNVQHVVRRRVLGEVSGQESPGWCGFDDQDVAANPTDEDRLLAGSRLRGGLCQGFCTRNDVRKDGLCARGLRPYCAPQTKVGAHEPMCACFLAPATYNAILEEKQAALQGYTELAQQVNRVMDQVRDRGYCWYGDCRGAEPQSVGPPQQECPVQQIEVCVQNVSDSQLQAARDININLNCNYSNQTPAAPKPAPPTNTVMSSTGTLPTPADGTPSNGTPPMVIVAAVAVCLAIPAAMIIASGKK